MGVFKEEMYIIEEFARKQSQLVADACDYGVFLNALEIQQLREVVQTLRSCCHTRPVSRFKGHTGEETRTDVYVAWEADGPVYNGSLVTITTWKYTSGRKAGATVFTINVKNKQMPVDEFQKSKILSNEFVFSA